MSNTAKQRLIFITLSLLGVILILFFGLRVFHAFKKFDRQHPPRFADELQTDVDAIEEWMTIPFISHNYGVPPDTLFDALNIDPGDKDDFKKSLKQLNDEYYPDNDGYVLATIKATILAHQSPAVPVPPDPPDPPTPWSP